MGRNKLQVNMARLMAVCLVIALLLPMVPTALAISGDCGAGVTWTLESGVLTVSGEGAMQDFSEEKPAPWQAHKDVIHAVQIQEGVTAVGDCAFLEMGNVASVTLPQSLTQIGAWAFAGCYKLALLDLGGVQIIEQCAFERCAALKSLRLPDTLTSLHYRAFYACSSLVSVTVPASVTYMEASVFAHCKALQNATVLAYIPELPSWTFYNCEQLKSVTMPPTIEKIGYNAFFDCAIEEPEYGHVGMTSVENTATQEHDGASVTTDSSYQENTNSAIQTQIVTTKKDSKKTVEVTIEAVLENAEGWQDVEEAVLNGLKPADRVTAHVWLKGDSIVSGGDLNRFKGKNVTLILHTTQGAQWYINGKDLAGAKLKKRYELSYTLKKLEQPNEAQMEALAGNDGYLLTFHKVLDFKVEVDLPLSQSYQRQSAVFFTPEKDGYLRRQAVMIDTLGVAHFSLGQVDKNVDYLIGINVPQKAEQESQKPASDVIIPDSMKQEYPQLEQVEEKEYVVTGVKSSLGISIGQLALILAGVMAGAVIVVGIVISISFRRKLKKGYVPDMSYADENEDA